MLFFIECLYTLEIIKKIHYYGKVLLPTSNRVKKSKSIIYVNFSPYDNAGKILDYLLNTFDVVAVFIFNFNNLGNKQGSGKLTVYKNKKIVKQSTFFQMSSHIPVSLIFLLIPLRSSINFLQLFWYSIKLKKEFGTFDYYFTVNAFTAWCGNILRKFGFVKKTIFWVWDYYPPLHPNKIILFMRWLYWQFDKNVSVTSDRVVFLNKRLETLRKDINIIPIGETYPIVPIGTDPLENIQKKIIKDSKIIFGFLGVLKKTQGLDMFFDSLDEIKKTFPNSKLEILGSGPDETHYKNRVKNSPIPVKFYGFIPKDENVKKIQLGWDIGIALYVPEESNVSYYTDPSKIKGYLSLGIPVIITDITFANEIRKQKAGMVIAYGKTKELVDAIHTILNNYSYYQKNALILAKKYSYQKIYRRMFEL